MGIAAEIVRLLEEGFDTIGQVRILRTGGGFDLRHVDDAGRGDLHVWCRPEEARQIAASDDAGGYRPLKTAPNLRRGWSLRVSGAEELRLALDFLYPAMIGTFLEWRAGGLMPVPLRETLGRQTGMYRVTVRITDAQAGELIAEHCKLEGGCLRKILWSLSAETPLKGLSPAKTDPDGVREGEIPLLCAEACNLLVAAARPVAKQTPPSK